MNLLLIIAAVVLIANIIEGSRNGLVRQLIGFVSVIIMGVVAALILNGLESYTAGRTLSLILSIVLLCAIGLVRHLLSVVFVPAKLISRLPIVSWLDKLLGILFGILETVLILWIIYTFVMMTDMGMIGEQIVEYTRQSRVLTWLYQHNYLAYLIETYVLEFPLAATLAE
ncbi:MAG: CvpA family protein [Lachnospiraceae bacterium]|nr:CvpA family protein [Lachnospiraceae bacterium]